MNQSHTTYASVGVGGSIAVILPWLLKAITGQEMPSEVAIAFDSLFSMAIAYFLHQVPKQEIPK